LGHPIQYTEKKLLKTPFLFQNLGQTFLHLPIGETPARVPGHDLYVGLVVIVRDKDFLVDDELDVLVLRDGELSFFNFYDKIVALLLLFPVFLERL
jgi:hypothetical protein